MKHLTLVPDERMLWAFVSKPMNLGTYSHGPGTVFRVWVDPASEAHAYIDSTGRWTRDPEHDRSEAS